MYVDYSKGRVIVSFPWQAGEEDFDPETAVKELGESAILKFAKGTTRPEKDDDPNLVLTGADVETAEAMQYQDKTTNQVTYVVSLKLKSEGTKKFADATAELYPNHGQISIWMDETMISAPAVQAVINDGSAQISGDFTYESAKALADKINAGSLPFKLETTSTNIISATLGENALTAMAYAAVVAFILIALIMIIFYRLPGFVAIIALIGQMGLTVAAVSGYFPAFPSFTMTLPGIAGMILSIGMGVDCNVITAERIK